MNSPLKVESISPGKISLKSKLPDIKKGIRKPKVDSQTVAERIVWMSRTSDVLGSHIQSDLESYLTLIRRKIQEKCATTQDLIYHIRRNKVTDKFHVTPGEFRYTLIKFGVILPQPLVDRVFNVFDSDRSGTMDVSIVDTLNSIYFNFFIIVV